MSSAKLPPVPCVFIARPTTFEGTDRMVLASLIADLGPLPDCARYLARLLNVSERTARTYRDSLAGDGLVDRVDGWLVIDEVAFASWQQRARADFAARGLRFAFDAIPRVALAWGQSPTELRNVAIAFGEAVGRFADRPGCRADSERAALAGGSRRQAVAARKTLVEHGFRVEGRRVAFRLPNGGTAEKVLQRVRLPDDPATRRELCRLPAILSRRSKQAAVAAAEAGRTRALTVGRSRSSGRWAAPAPSATEAQHPSATKAAFPITPSSGVTPSPRNAEADRHGDRAALDRRMAPEPEPAAAPPVADLLGTLAAALRPDGDRTARMPWQCQPREPAQNLPELLADQPRLEQLRQRPAADAIAAVLEAGACFTWPTAPLRVQRNLADRRRRLAEHAAEALGAAAFDEALRLARQSLRKRTPARWLIDALACTSQRVRAGLQARPDFERRRRGERPAARDHARHEDRARSEATAAAVLAVRHEDARKLLAFAERGANLQEVARSTGLDVAELQRRVDDEREAQRQRFEASIGRRTA